MPCSLKGRCPSSFLSNVTSPWHVLIYRKVSCPLHSRWILLGLDITFLTAGRPVQSVLFYRSRLDARNAARKSEKGLCWGVGVSFWVMPLFQGHPGRRCRQETCSDVHEGHKQDTEPHRTGLKRTLSIVFYISMFSSICLCVTLFITGQFHLDLGPDIL